MSPPVGLPRAACETLKRVREAQGLTQKRIAEKAELSPSYINQIEKGKKGASLKTLQEQIGPAYGIDNIFEVVQSSEAEEKTIVIINEETPLEPLRLGRRDKLVYEMSPNKVIDERMFVSLVTLKSRSSSGMTNHPGEEVISMIEGSIEIVLEDETYPLEARENDGDIAHFKSTTNHELRNPGPDLAKMLIIRFPAHRA